MFVYRMVATDNSGMSLKAMCSLLQDIQSHCDWAIRNAVLLFEVNSDGEMSCNSMV